MYSILHVLYFPIKYNKVKNGTTPFYFTLINFSSLFSLTWIKHTHVHKHRHNSLLLIASCSFQFNLVSDQLLKWMREVMCFFLCIVLSILMHFNISFISNIINRFKYCQSFLWGEKRRRQPKFFKMSFFF